MSKAKQILTTFAVIIVLILMLGCGPSTTGPIVTKPTIQQDVDSLSIERFMKYTNGLNADTFITTDKNYTIVDEEWFKANVMNGYTSFLSKNGVAFSNQKKNDCDDFARGFSFFSRVKSMQAGFLNHNLPVADVYYRTLDFGHAINAAVVFDKNKQLKLIFIEPQGPTLVTMEDEYKKFYTIYTGL